MNSYTLVNGDHATQNEFLNLKVLKGDWGFQGVLMSDWDATYDGVAAANNGLDLEMPSARFMCRGQLRRNQYRKYCRSRSSPALRLRSLCKGQPPGARIEGL